MSNKPAYPLRRIQRKSAKSNSKPNSTAHVDTRRQLKYESLETRCVLSADGLDVLADNLDAEPNSTAFFGSTEPEEQAPAFFQTSQQSTQIESLTLSVNGSERTVTEAWSRLSFQAGDVVEIIDITFTYDGSDPTGVFAAESYINKLEDFTNASLIDYEDGRFSDPADDLEAVAGQSSLAGVKGSWTLEEGWDRLTVTLMHYTESGAEVTSRFSIHIEVGQPEFGFDTEVLDQIRDANLVAGEETKIPVSWVNTGDGKYHDYAEVDVFYGDESGPVVWAGALVGNTNGDPVSGFATNTRGDFSEYWTPDQAGTYTLLYTVDPEHVWSEADKGNNQYIIVVEVAENNSAPVAVDDAVGLNEGESTEIDVLENDYDPDGDELTIEEFEQPENGTVTLNEEDGTLSYTPDDGFTGEDEFSYVATDGESSSETATVRIKVEDVGVTADDAQGNEDEWISLSIELDKSQFKSVEISGVPEGAELSHGHESEEGTYTVRSRDLKKLAILPTENSDADFQLQVAPVDKAGTVYSENSVTLNVTVDPVYDGAELYVRNFGIEAGRSGTFPSQFFEYDDDGSEVHEVVLSNVPDFVTFSHGFHRGGEWVFNGSELSQGTQVIAGYAEDTSGWSRVGSYVYQRFNVDAHVSGHETDGGEGGEFERKFVLFFFQRL